MGDYLPLEVKEERRILYTQPTIEASTNEEVRREGARRRLHKISGTCMQGPAKIQSGEECFPESDDESPVHTKKNQSCATIGD